MKVLVVDDHALVRQGLAALLAGQGVVSAVVHAGGVAEALSMIDAHTDLEAVLLDLRLAGEDGVEAVGHIALRRPDLPVLILSSSEDPADVRRALDAGALGYVPKSASPETLMSAVESVLAGDIFTPAFMAGAPPPPSGGADLTPRQREMLIAVANGLSNKEIALKHDLSEKTVKVHVSAIFRALSVTNRTQAATAALAAGLIPPRRPPPGG
ncbi:MAG: response regulator transcription factor [Pseudomonadota bacterium]